MNIFIRAIPILLFSIVAIYIIIARRKQIKGNAIIVSLFLIVECIVIFKVDFPSVLYDEINVSIAQEESNEYSEVVINGLVYNDKNHYFVGEINMPFPEIIHGRWAWQNYQYKWTNDSGMLLECTDSITLKVPVYDNRYISFETGENDGKVTVECNGEVVECNLNAKTDGKKTVAIPDPNTKKLLCNLICITIIFCAFSVLMLGLILHIYNLISGKLKKFIKKKPYEITFFAVSLIQIVLRGIFPNCFEYTSSFYALNYEYGFAKRGLWGAVFTYIFPYITEEQLRVFKLFFVILLYIFLSFVVGTLVRKIDDRKMRWFLVLFFCSLPNTYLYTANDVLPTDIFPLVIFIVSVMFICNDEKIWIVPMLTFIMLLFNETSIVYYVPVICMMMIYCYLLVRKKKYIFYMVMCILMDLPLAMYFLTSKSPINSATIQDVLHHIPYHAGYKYSESAYIAESFELKNHIACVSQYLLAHKAECLIFFIVLIPLFSLIFKMVVAVYEKGLKDSNFIEKLGFYALVITCFFSIVCMLIAWDFTRYTAIIIITILAVIFFIIENKHVSLSYEDISTPNTCVTVNDEEKIDLMPIIICIFYIICGCFKSAVNNTDFVTRIFSFFSNL